MDEARPNYTMLDFIKSTVSLEFVESGNEDRFLDGENTPQIQQELLVGVTSTMESCCVRAISISWAERPGCDKLLAW